MSLLVVGSVALDTVETPYGSAREELGGSAVYFSLAASRFSPVRLVGVVGRDFPQAYVDRLAAQPIDLAGLQRVEGETFRWHGAYQGRMEQARTVDVKLNVFGDFVPTIPAQYTDSQYVFLANGSPRTHMHVLDQVDRPKLVLADTMNFYIQNERDALLELMQRVDGLILNDMEALQLSGEPHLLGAARWVCGHGPAWCIIKKGEHGALLRGQQGLFVLPGFPHESVVDPTGAGDAFAGGLMGYVASKDAVDMETLESGLVYGTITASFAIEQLGPAGLESLTQEAMQKRLDELLAACRLLRS
jgi:sugar/nucleoside kinase (ribokinase family)